jgi:inosine-uridine nucleoside N-ribohydrolase
MVASGLPAAPGAAQAGGEFPGVRRLLIDCDPGIDDALAIYAALASDALAVQGITTVYGNVPVRQATRNVARVLARLERPPKLLIGEGAEQPLTASRLPRRGLHGRDGLGDVHSIPVVPVPTPLPESTPLMRDLLARNVLQEIVALGPLTNLAHVFASAPTLLRRLGRISVMGGVVMGIGDPSASEFNVASDPAAARCVLNSRVPLRWVPLNVAASIVIPQEAIEQFRAGHPRSRVASTIAELLSCTARTRDRGGAVVPDAVALALALDPGLGVWRARRLVLEARTRLGRMRLESGLPNAQLCEAVDGARVMALLWKLWSSLATRDAAHS